MEAQVKNNLKLGSLVLAGMALLVLALYGVGKNQNLFGSNFRLKARFVNVNGLMKGNNIRFSGIQVGTVSDIRILNDTSIEVIMLINQKMKPFIHNNALASIGTEGLMGNKIINIMPSPSPAPLVAENDLLVARPVASTDEMLQTLSRSNENIAFLSEDLRNTVRKISRSTTLQSLLNDSSLVPNLRATLQHIKGASVNAQAFTEDIRQLILQTKEGKGSVGRLLTDTGLYRDLARSAANIDSAGKGAAGLIAHLDEMVLQMKEDIGKGKGTANALLKDSGIVVKLNITLDNLKKGTDGFNQNMEALKHNFLFRGYFRRLEKQQDQRR